MIEQEFEPDFVAYTDGSYIIPKDIGASACVILPANKDEILYQWSKVCRDSTNNRQELGAIIHVVMNVPLGSSVEIRSDSEYSIGVLGGTMRGKLNTDLISIYRATIDERQINVRFEWVRGHAGDYYNEFADSLCTEAVDRFYSDGTRILKSENYCEAYLQEKALDNE